MAACLSQPGTLSTGIALLEGILCAAPTPYFAACLSVALATPDASARQAALGILQQVPAEMLTQDILSDILAQVCWRSLSSSLSRRASIHDWVSIITASCLLCS